MTDPENFREDLKIKLKKKRKECFWISFKFCLIFSFMMLSVRKFYKNSLFFTSSLYEYLDIYAH